MTNKVTREQTVSKLAYVWYLRARKLLGKRQHLTRVIIILASCIILSTIYTFRTESDLFDLRNMVNGKNENTPAFLKVKDAVKIDRSESTKRSDDIKDALKRLDGKKSSNVKTDATEYRNPEKNKKKLSVKEAKKMLVEDRLNEMKGHGQNSLKPKDNSRKEKEASEMMGRKSSNALTQEQLDEEEIEKVKKEIEKEAEIIGDDFEFE